MFPRSNLHCRCVATGLGVLGSRRMFLVTCMPLLPATTWNVIHMMVLVSHTPASPFLTCVDIPKHSFTKTRRFASVGCSRDLSIRRQVMDNQEPVANEGVDYCPVVYGMPCSEDRTLSRGAPASLSNYATYTPAWEQTAFHVSSTSSLEAWASTTRMRDCALMPTLLQALFKRPAPNPCKDAGLAARLDHHTPATCSNNESQF